MLRRILRHPPVVVPLTRVDRRRLAARDPQAASAIKLVASLYDVSVQHMLGTTRRAEVVLARHVAIYVLNTILQRPLYEAAGIFGRDRKSARYACARVEDARDRPEFDAAMDRIEQLLKKSERAVRHVAG